MQLAEILKRYAVTEKMLCESQGIAVPDVYNHIWSVSFPMFTDKCLLLRGGTYTREQGMTKFPKRESEFFHLFFVPRSTFVQSFVTALFNIWIHLASVR